MKAKLIVIGSKVKRIDDRPRGVRRHLTARNALGLAGIIAFAVWMIDLILGGA
jgi:hypothetical protein